MQQKQQLPFRRRYRCDIKQHRRGGSNNKQAEHGWDEDRLENKGELNEKSWLISYVGLEQGDN